MPDTFIEKMPLSSLVAPPRNRDIGDVTELAASMKEKGVLQPILVAPRGKKYVVAAGNRRWAAAKVAGLTHVPALVRELSDEDIIEIRVIENCQRKDITPVEEARALAELVALGRSQRDIATKIGTTQGHVSKRLALLKLPEAVLAKIEQGAVTLADAALLVDLADHPAKLEKVIAHGGHIAYSVQRAKEEIKAEETAKATKAMAKSKGLKLLKSTDKWGFRPPEGAWLIGKDYGALDLDAKKHAAEPCHAIGLCPRTGKAVPCCTDRTRHPEVKSKASQQAGSAERDAAAAERQRLQDEWQAASERRLEVVANMHRSVSERVVLGLAARVAIVRLQPSMLCRALAAMGLPVPAGMDKNHWERTPEQDEAANAAIGRLESEVTSNVRRAQQLLWLVTAMELESQYMDPKSPHTRNLEYYKDDLGVYVRALMAEGFYEPLPREREYFGMVVEKKVSKAKATELANA